MLDQQLRAVQLPLHDQPTGELIAEQKEVLGDLEVYLVRLQNVLVGRDRLEVGQLQVRDEERLSVRSTALQNLIKGLLTCSLKWVHTSIKWLRQQIFSGLRVLPWAECLAFLGELPWLAFWV